MLTLLKIILWTVLFNLGFMGPWSEERKRVVIFWTWRILCDGQLVKRLFCLAGLAQKGVAGSILLDAKVSIFFQNQWP